MFGSARVQTVVVLSDVGEHRNTFVDVINTSSVTSHNPTFPAFRHVLVVTVADLCADSYNRLQY